MGNRQDQNTSENSTAIQAEGNVNYKQETFNIYQQNGISSEQLAKIVSSITVELMRSQADVARAEVQKALEEFQHRIIANFSDDSKSRISAFQETDFLACLGEAARSYTRTNDPDRRTLLLELVAKRSLEESDNRLSLVLNDAIAEAGKIPVEDLNALSLIFIFKHSQINSAISIESLAFILQSVSPIIDRISTSESSMLYLAAHRCLTPPVFGLSSGTAFEILTSRYSKQIQDFPTDQELFLRATEAVAPKMRDLLSTFDQTNIRNSLLTSTGIALAYARLSNGIFKNLDLRNWISD